MTIGCWPGPWLASQRRTVPSTPADAKACPAPVEARFHCTSSTDPSWPLKPFLPTWAIQCQNHKIDSGGHFPVNPPPSDLLPGSHKHILQRSSRPLSAPRGRSARRTSPKKSSCNGALALAVSHNRRCSWPKRSVVSGIRNAATAFKSFKRRFVEISQQCSANLRAAALSVDQPRSSARRTRSRGGGRGSSGSRRGRSPRPAVPGVVLPARHIIRNQPCRIPD